MFRYLQSLFFVRIVISALVVATGLGAAAYGQAANAPHPSAIPLNAPVGHLMPDVDAGLVPRARVSHPSFLERNPLVSMNGERSQSRPLRDLPNSTQVFIPKTNRSSLRPATRRAASPLSAPSENFDGMACKTTPTGVCVGTPPDPNGAIGPAGFMEFVNAGIALYSRTGTVLMQPKSLSALFSGLSTGDGNACGITDDGDGLVVYDRAANRYIISQFDLHEYDNETGNESFQCVAVSETGDPTGAYYTYDFAYQYAVNDYPKMGIWPDGYYMTFDMFDQYGNYYGADFCVYNRVAMLSGQAAAQQCFQQADWVYGVEPATVDSSTPPPSGSPEYIVGYDPDQTGMDVWQFHTDWTTPSNSTVSPYTEVSVPSFNPSCNDDYGSSCIPVPPPGNSLDSLSEMTMFRVAYHNEGSYESLLVTHTVTPSNVAGIRWYELRFGGSSDAPLSLYQSGTFVPDTLNRFMPSAAMDGAGDIAIGYSLANASTYPELGYAGRLYSDTLGTIGNEDIAFEGSGVETGNFSDGSVAERWGDYSDLTVDPLDECTFWYVGEYYAVNGIAVWSTRIMSFTFPSCSQNAITVAVKAKGTYGTTPNLSDLPAGDLSITPSSAASAVSGSVSCATAATSASSVSATPYVLYGCGGLQATNRAIVYDYSHSGYTVTKAGPKLSWSKPAAITYGTALSSTQLDATSSVAGTMSYSPPVGAVLHTGNGQALTATFTPTDTVDYTSSSKATSITVNPAPLTVTAGNGSVNFGTKPPTYTYTVAGFVNGDTASAITTAPVCTSTVNLNSSGKDTSPAGAYAITCSGAKASDYGFTYEPGTLTVRRAPTVLTYTGPTSAAHGSKVTFTATLTGYSKPVSGRKLTFTLGSQSCSGATNAQGRGSCWIMVQASGGMYTVGVAFKGDPSGASADYAAKSTAASFTVSA